MAVFSKWNMSNLISVVVPTYNRAHSLRAAVLSVLNQCSDNWELIIVDDGSTDNTKEIIEELVVNEKIRYYYQDNAGVSAARNKGVQLSRGDYVIFLDSDDCFFPGLITRLNEIEFRSYDLICWQVLKCIDGKSSIWEPQKLGKMYNHITATFLSGSICYKKDIIEAVGFFDPKMSFGENYELGLRISEKTGLKIKILKQHFLFYEIIKDNRKSNSLANRLNSYEHLYNKHNEKYRENFKSHSRMKYLLGFVYEKSGLNEDAKKYYFSSFKTNPFNFKALLKSVYFSFLSR